MMLYKVLKHFKICQIISSKSLWRILKVSKTAEIKYLNMDILPSLILILTSLFQHQGLAELCYCHV